MAFELLEKKLGILGLPRNQLSISKTSVSFGDNFTPILMEYGYVEIYVDRVLKRIGFKPTHKGDSSYKIQFDKSNSKRASLSASKISSMIPKGRYDIFVDENKYLVIEVKEIVEKKDNDDIDLVKV